MWRAGGIFVLLLAVLAGIAQAAPRKAPLHDPVLLRIGILSRWERNCMKEQQSAMAAALRYVERKSPPPLRIHACNRNASRGSGKVDWIGFYNCIRNKRI
jgi:hypothetical protein